MQPPYNCPRCRASLTHRRLDPGSSWFCGACGGAAITMAVVRQRAARTLTNMIWSEARSSRKESTLICPGCTRPLKTFDVNDSKGRTELDGCVACQFLWFDASELGRLGVVLSELPHAKVRRVAEDSWVVNHRDALPARPLSETILDLLLNADWW